MSHKATHTDVHEVMPATATRLVVMLYDGAIASLNQALEAIEAEDLAGRCRSINMAVDILANLCVALDTEQGGEIARNLERLYGFMIGRLQRANLMNDPAPVREVAELLETLYGAWRELDRRVTEEAYLQAMAPTGEGERVRAAG